MNRSKGKQNEQASGRQAETILLPASLEKALRGRASLASELPQLARRVQVELDSREQARLWLAQHGGLGFRAKVYRARRSSDSRRIDRRPDLKSVIAPSVWRGLGASLAGAIVGYALLTGLPQQNVAPWLASIGGLSVALAAVLAVTALCASQWSTLRGMLRT